MRWRPRAVASRAKERANISFFIFVVFFAVFGVIVLTELLILDRRGNPITSRWRYGEELQDATSCHGNTHTRSVVTMECSGAVVKVILYLSKIWQISVNPGKVEGSTESGTEETISLPPVREPRDAVWQPVGGTRFKFLVYSAFVERRTVNAVRIIAATKTRGPDPVVCRIWLPDNRTLTLRARVKAIRENWNLKYSATYVLCLLRDTGLKPSDTVGASVAVIASTSLGRAPTNLLVVIDTEPKPDLEETLHVCVKPFHYSYSRVDWLLEWFEMNRLLGVTHFYMYNHSLSYQVNCLLEQYKKQGLVTLLSWKLPLQSKVDIRTEGQFAAFNDCLYRSMTSSTWLLLLDVDELVLPRRERTLLALLAALYGAQPTNMRAKAAVMFRNSFFYLPWEDDPDSPVPLVTARKTRRWSVPHAYKNRSKYAVRPREVVELGNHFVWQFVPGANFIGVPTDRALMHHYRIACEYGGTQCLKVISTVDRTAHRWSEELFKRVTQEKKNNELNCVRN